MGLLLSPVLYQSRPGILWHLCPGCQERHPVHVKVEGRDSKSASTWDWDGNTERPTFHPSIRVFNHTGTTQCHYFIRRGNIVFCSDSAHPLAGQTVALPTLPGNEDNT